MLHIVAGCIGFVLFILYDLNQMQFKKKLFRPFFAIGFFLVAFSTWRVLSEEKIGITTPFFSKIFLGIIAALMFILLIYSLFFALPFKQTYIIANNRHVYDKGMYALCRHPGVLWFILFYFLLWLMTERVMMFWAFLLFSVCNLIYSFLQDRYFFPALFDDYGRYRKTTPFLLPTCSSIRRCLTSIRK